MVAIFPSLEGESLEDFSIRLAQKWSIGQKGLDNGVILLVFVEDQKVRIEVGYGLEADAARREPARIIREAVAPRFREGDPRGRAARRSEGNRATPSGARTGGRH